MNVLLWTRGGGQYQATTDDNGTFHIEGIAPGSYHARFEREGFVPFQRDSNPIVVGSGAEPVRVRIEMSPYATLRGRVLGPGGEPVADVEVEIRSYLSSYAQRTASTASDGSFVFEGLSGGAFYLRATPKRSLPKSDPERVEIVPTYFPSAEERVQAEKILVRAGVESTGYEIRLRALPVYRLAGRGGSREPTQAGFMLMTTDGQGSIVAVSRREGKLRVPNLIPGAYRFLAVPSPTFAFSPASVLLGDKDVLGQVVELTAAAPALRVIFNANTNSVRGTVEKGECKVILLLPNPPVPPVGGRSQPCKAGEAFEFAGVPPGDYYALAFDRLDPNAPFDPAYLSSFLPYATRVSVGQGPAVPLQLPITAVPP